MFSIVETETIFKEIEMADIELVRLTITVESQDQKDAILEVLEEGEMNGELDFTIDVRTEFVTDEERI